MNSTLRAREASRLSRRSGSNRTKLFFIPISSLYGDLIFLESDIAFFITIYHFFKNVYNIKI